MVDEGDTFEYTSSLMVWIWRIIIITIVVIYIFVFTVGYLSKDVDISNIEANNLKYRLLFSPNCLAYTDNQIIQPGIIDVTKFEDIRINKCFQKDNFNFELNLYDLNNKKIKSVQSSPQGTQLAPLCNSIKTIKCSNIKEYVLIKDQLGGITPAIFELVIIKNV